MPEGFKRFYFSDTLVRRQCLPVGLDERLAFFITGTQGCLPRLMTVVVEPTASITENQHIRPARVGACTSTT